MLNRVAYHLVRSLVLLLLFPILLSAAPPPNPFCSDAGCAGTRQFFRQLCNYIVKDKNTYPVIFIGGYYMRTLVAAYEILGDRRYLDTAIAYGDYLLKRQMPSGYWATGYGTVYFADTGSALGLLVVLYKHVDRDRQKQYLDAVQRYVNSIQKDGMIHTNGALGTGWRHAENNKLSDPIPDEYTISSALTGGEIFTWMYHMTKQEKYRDVAYHALQWIMSNMRDDGNIPYILAMENADWAKRGEPKTDYNLWTWATYITSAYVGEGVLSFDLYCDQPAWRKWIQKAIQPQIEFLLRTQNPSGTWAVPNTWDEKRAPGVVDFLVWYYEHANKDARVAQAVKKFDAFVLDPQKAKAYGLLNAGAVQTGENLDDDDVLTSLTGRAVADMLSPGIDAKW